MCAELSVAALWIRRDREPDWGAAECAIRALDLATVWDTGEDYFPWDDWLALASFPPQGLGVSAPPAPFGVYRGLRAAQEHLERTLAEVRESVDAGAQNALVAELPDHLVYAAGCVTAGDAPADPLDAFADFGESGLAAAAGFEGWTEHCPRQISERHLRFSASERRWVVASRALMFAEDLALEGPLGDALFTPEPPERMRQLWLEPLRSARRLRREDRMLRTLMLYAARTYALLDELWARGVGDDGDLGEIPPIVIQTASLFDGGDIPHRRPGGISELLRDTVAEAEIWARELKLLGERGNRKLVDHLERTHGTPLPQALAVEIIAEHFAPLVMGIADVAGPQLTRVSAPEHPVDLKRRPRRRGVVDRDYEAYLGWCAAKRLDLDAAGACVERIADTTLRDRLRRDLVPFAELARGEYRPLVTSERVGDLRVWFTAEESGDGWTLNQPLRRLADAGVLEAAGAVAWSRAAPQGQHP